MAATLATVALSVGLMAIRARRERRPDDDERLPRGERGFGLRDGETPAAGLRRIALGQLDDAIELLRGQAPGSPPAAEAVHETRKAIKRLRALMRLLEGELGRRRATRERDALGAAADRLAGARDAEVMVVTLERLLAREPRKLARGRGVRELRERLERERYEATARLIEDAQARERVAGELVAVRARVAAWELRADRPAARLAGPGLQRIVRAGRRGRRRAVKRGSDPRARHRWRKHVKDLRYALEALTVAQPAREDAAGPWTRRPSKRERRAHGRERRAHGRLVKLARRADRLGETLGEEHDLVLLGKLVRADRRLKRRHKRARRRLLHAIEGRARRLRRRAWRQGKRLYADERRLLERAARG